MNKVKLLKPITVDINKLSHDGRGIATINGKTTFINGALSGETVICNIIKHHNRYNEAETIEILHPSAQRVQSHCAHFGTCGGCSMQHMDASAQIQFKQNVLLEQLKHFGKVTPEEILSPLSGNFWNYRRKARLGVRYFKKTDRIVIGFREKLSNILTEINTCSILHASVSTKMNELSNLIRSLSQFEHIPQIEVAVSDAETALIFRHLKPFTKEDILKLCDFAKAHNMHFYLQPNSPEKVHKIWPQNSNEYLSYQLSDYQLDIQFYPLDFIQVNGETNKLLLQQALRLLDPQPTDSVLDLFCGLGNFTLPIARYAQHVVGVEGNNEMVLQAQHNAHHNSINNVEFFAANLMKPSTQAPWIQKKYHKLLLDPPRSGAKEILPFIHNFSAKRIVYVSCNPATLARDAGELVYTLKYKLKCVGVVNMFPHTSHIEAIALFEK